MDKHTQRNLDELEEQISELLTTGSHGTAAELYGRKAALYLNIGDFPKAAVEFDKAAQLAGEDKEVGAEAHIRYALGMTLEHVDGARKQATLSLSHAARLYKQAKNREHSAKAYHRVANLHIGVADFDSAITALKQALVSVDSQTTPDLAIQLHRQHAALHWMHERYEDAANALDAALNIAKINKNEAVIVAVQAEQTAIEQDMKGEVTGKTADPFASLLKVGMQAGDMQVVTDVQLQQASAALEKGDYQEAETHADNARQSATQATDVGRYLRYLMACIVISVAREQMDDRAGVIEILLTCKATLDRQLGPETGGQVKQLLDALQIRWGQAGVQEALREYRQRMQQADDS